jgi:hypothetical protein
MSDVEESCFTEEGTDYFVDRAKGLSSELYYVRVTG